MRSLLLVAILAVCAGAQEFHRPSEYTFPPEWTYPDKDWERIADPAQAGYSKAKLDVLRAWLKTQHTTSMMVVRGGRVLFEYGDTSEVSKVASVRKSILGMLFGKYIAPDSRVLHATVKALGLDDLDAFEGPEANATLQDLLMARSGIYYADGDDASPRKGSQAPGTRFQYNNWDYNAAGTAFEKISGKNIYDALEADLAKPLGFQDFDRARQKKIEVVPGRVISKHSEYAMYLSTRDLARLGLLMARAGRWKDRQVMPKNWNEYLTTLVTQANETWPYELRKHFAYGPARWGYGVMWWVWDAPIGTSSAGWSDFTASYTASGTDGQFLTVLPALDLVISHKNSNIDASPQREVTMQQYMTILNMLVASRQ